MGGHGLAALDAALLIDHSAHLVITTNNGVFQIPTRLKGIQGRLRLPGDQLVGGYIKVAPSP